MNLFCILIKFSGAVFIINIFKGYGFFDNVNEPFGDYFLCDYIDFHARKKSKNKTKQNKKNRKKS